MNEMSKQLMEIDFMMEDLENNLTIITLDELQKAEKELKKKEELIDEQFGNISQRIV